MHNVALDTIKEKLEEREKDLQESKMQQNKAQVAKFPGKNFQL